MKQQRKRRSLNENKNHPKTMPYNATNFLNAPKNNKIKKLSDVQSFESNYGCIWYVKRHIEFSQIYCAKFA